MATFTFRIPSGMAGRLNSAEMRTWLTQFLRSPYYLPPDPGSGSERISLTLPRELVRDLAGYLGCSPSIALRRLAAARLGLQAAPKRIGLRPSERMTIVAPKRSAGPRRAVPGGFPTRPAHDNVPAAAPAEERTGAWWVPMVIGAVTIGALIFFGTGQIGGYEST